MVLNLAIELLALLGLLLSTAVLVLHPELSTAHRAAVALTASLSTFTLVFRKARP